MTLTPMQIHDKEFSRAFRGYNENEVDEFLDQVVEEFEKLYKNNIDLKDKLSMVSDQVENYKSIENTLKETLVTAQKTADDVAASAQKKAQLIIEDAQNQAKKIIENANIEVVNIKKEYADYKKQFQIFRNKFKGFLQTQMEMIEHDKELFDDIS